MRAVTGRGLFAKTSIVSGMTLVSRILGLVRDIVLARFFGAGLVIDAFVVANRIPNMLRRFFGEGAFSAGFVPVMARFRERHSLAETREFVDAVLAAKSRGGTVDEFAQSWTMPARYVEKGYVSMAHLRPPRADAEVIWREAR